MEVREGRYYERLFAFIKEPKDELLKGGSLGGLCALQALIMDGISESLKQAAMLELARMDPKSKIDPLKAQMGLTEVDQQLAKLDRLLGRVIEEINIRFEHKPTTSEEKDEK